MFLYPLCLYIGKPPGKVGELSCKLATVVPATSSKSSCAPCGIKTTTATTTTNAPRTALSAPANPIHFITHIYIIHDTEETFVFLILYCNGNILLFYSCSKPARSMSLVCTHYIVCCKPREECTILSNVSASQCKRRAARQPKEWER